MIDDSSTYRERRTLASAFALCALATLTLLANHPSDGGAKTFADFIQSTAQSQLADAIVHGGFIVTLAALIICFVFFCRCLGPMRGRVVIGLVTFCIGCGALMASMVVDGFVTPALATRFSDLSHPENLAMAKTLLILCGTLIRFLMPMGLLFQAAAMLSWSSIVVTGRGLARAVGVFGLFAALCLVVALFVVPMAMAAQVVLGGILLQAIWYFALAALLFSHDPAPGAEESLPREV